MDGMREGDDGDISALKFSVSPNFLRVLMLIESLLFIEIPTNDLVLYLARGLGLHGESGSQLKENPITMMYAVMYMTEKLFSKLQTNNQTFEVQSLNSVSVKQPIKP
jgi:hypothetical protein